MNNISQILQFDEMDFCAKEEILVQSYRNWLHYDAERFLPAEILRLFPVTNQCDEIRVQIWLNYNEDGLHRDEIFESFPVMN